MLYHPSTKTLRETIAPGRITSEGATLDEAHLTELARCIGKRGAEGDVDVVSVFFVLASEARVWTSMAERLGLEVRTLVGEDEVVVVPPRRVPAEGRVLLPKLRPDDWPDAPQRLCRRLLSAEAGVGPWVSFGYDLPDTFAAVTLSGALAPKPEDFEPRAVATLAKRTPQRSDVAPGLVCFEDEYAAEMVLLPDLLRRVREELAAPVLALAIPRQCLLFATSAVGKELPGLFGIAKGMFRDSPPKARLSPLVLATMHDAPAGVIGVGPPG